LGEWLLSLTLGLAMSGCDVISFPRPSVMQGDPTGAKKADELLRAP
jgi:hypothetical protein